MVLGHITISVADVVNVLHILLIGEIEACSVGHVHFKTARCKTLHLSLLNASNFLFGVAY